MINITSYSKNKKDTGSSTTDNSTGGIYPTLNSTANTDTVYIWGQQHNHTEKVINGVLTTPSDIDSTANINCHGVVKIDSEENEYRVGGNIYADNIESETGKIDGLMSTNGNITLLNSQDITTDRIKGLLGEFTSIGVTYGHIDNIYNNYLESEDAYIHNLTVTGKAHFFELVIDKIKAAGGAVVFSPADGFTVNYIQYQWPDFKYRLPIGFYPVYPNSNATSHFLSEYQSRINSGESMFVRTQDTNELYEITNRKITTTGNNYYLTFSSAVKCSSIESKVVFDKYFDTYRSDKTARSLGYPEIKLYWKAKEDDGTKVRNMWEVNDQLICQNFNSATEGTSYDVSNKYYWGLVTGVSSEPVLTYNQVPYNTQETTYRDNWTSSWSFDFDSNPIYCPTYCHWILFKSDTSTLIDKSDSSTDGNKKYAAGYVDPEIGDGIAMFGHRDNNNPDRQSAIYIASYVSIDPSIKPPLFAQYRGINRFSLSGKADSYFSRDKNLISGDTVIVSGKDLTKELNDINQSIQERYGDLYDDMTSLPITTEILTNVMQTTNFEYETWKNKIGTEYIFRCTGIKDIDDFDGKFYEGVNVFVEQISYVNTNEDIYTGEVNVTIYGKITSSNPPSGVTVAQQNTMRNVKVLIYMVLNANLADIYNKYASLKVTQDGITSEVADMQNGISTLQQTCNSLSGNITDLRGKYSAFVINQNGINTKVSNDIKGLSSEIDQTAEHINMRVNDLELRLEDNQITLDGNTQIIGDLVLNAEDQGLTILGPDGQVMELKPKKLDTYSTFSSKTVDSRNFSNSMSPYLAYSNATKGSWTLSDGKSYNKLTWNFNYTVKVSLGSLGNYNIKLTNFYALIDAYSYQLNGGSYPVFSQYGCNGAITKVIVDIYRSGSSSSLKRITINGSNSTSVTKSDLLSGEKNFINEDDYYMNVNIQGKVWVSYNSTTNTWANGNGIVLKLSSNVNRQKANSAYSLITYDGIGINFGDFKTIYFGKEGFKVRYGEYGIGIMPNKTQPFLKWNNNSQQWQAWDSLKNLYDN